MVAAARRHSQRPFASRWTQRNGTAASAGTSLRHDPPRTSVLIPEARTMTRWSRTVAENARRVLERRKRAAVRSARSSAGLCSGRAARGAMRTSERKCQQRGRPRAPRCRRTPCSWKRNRPMRPNWWVRQDGEGEAEIGDGGGERGEIGDGGERMREDVKLNWRGKREKKR